MESMKIVDRVNQVRERGEVPISFEFFPPKTEKSIETLKSKLLDEFASQRPAFVDFTWGAGGSTSELTLELSTFAQKHGLEVNMHLTCTNMPKELVETALKQAKEVGIKNIVALRGDPPKGQEVWIPSEGGFACALDLVQFIREQYGDYFGIAVAGYPEGHPNVIKEVEDVNSLTESEKGRLVHIDGKYLVCSDQDFAAEMAYLKKKVDAGADAIITQMFFDIEVFFTFVKECRAAEINVPILPGIMLISKIGGFDRMTAFCKTRVPEQLRQKLDNVKEDEAAVEKLGRDVIVEMCQQLLHAGYGLHLYTLNSEHASFSVLKELGLLKDNNAVA